jgi:hypothetical protein
MNPLEKAAIFEWQTPKNYMIHSLAPEAARLPATPLQTLENLLSALPADASALIFHLNCTVTENFPVCRSQFVEVLRSRGIPLLNGSVVNIGKRFLQTQLAFLGLPSTMTSQSEGRPDDLVIVKTDFNYGSYGELKLNLEERFALGMPTIDCPIKNSSEYKILRRSKVPTAWWRDPLLAIETYVDNPWGRKYRVYFAGSQCLIVAAIDKNKIKKTLTQESAVTYLTNLARMTSVGHSDLPSTLQIDVGRLIKHMRMDFGAIDLVQDHNGTCFIIDINTTSYWRPFYDHALEHLRTGLLSLILSPSQYPGTSGRGFSSVAAYVDSLASRERRRSPKALSIAEPLSIGAAPKTWRHKPPANGDSRLSIYPPSFYEPATDLCVIICVFNMEDKYSLKWLNYNLVVGLLSASGIHHLTVEFTLAGKSAVTTDIENVIRISSGSNLWQKERLVNEAAKQVPSHCRKIAWIDADILFENPNWARSASQMLETVPVVQLCERVARLPRGHHAYLGKGEVWETFGSVYARDPTAMDSGLFGLHGHTGFGWAARREIIDDHGLYDACVVGGADHVMAHAFCGDWDSQCIGKMMGAGSAWHEHARDWAKNLYPSIRSRVGVIRGTALHLWHGEIASRGHDTRYRILKEGGFNPREDLSLTTEGAWLWRGKRVDTYNRVSEYMLTRVNEGQ